MSKRSRNRASPVTNARRQIQLPGPYQAAKMGIALPLRPPIQIRDLEVYTWEACPCLHHDCMLYPTDLAERCTPGKVKYYAAAFVGEQGNPLWSYVYRSAAARDEAILKEMQRQKAIRKIKDERKAARKVPSDPGLKVGDILYASWGYDQTQIDFYQVAAIRGTAVDLREIGTRVVGGGRGSDEVVADPTYHGKLLKKRIQFYEGRPSIKIGDSRGYANLWNGRPLHQTASGYGH